MASAKPNGAVAFPTVHFISLRNPCSDVPAQQAPHGTGLTSPLVAPNPDFALCRGVWAVWGVWGCVEALLYTVVQLAHEVAFVSYIWA